MTETVATLFPASDPFTVTDRDIAAIDRVLSEIDRRNAQLDSFAYWKLALRLFKDFDLRFARMQDRSRFEPTHRVLLTSMLAATECLNSFAKTIDDGELERISLTKEALEANLKYLRSKHQQWYALVDPLTIQTVNLAIENGANASASRKNI
jgi:hypothetical protein